MKQRWIHLALYVLAFGLVLNTQAAEKNNKVFFRGAFSSLIDSRSGEVFTDTAGGSGTFNDGKAGFSVAGGIDLGMTNPKAMMDMASIVGEVSVEFSRFSSKTVRQTTSALLGGTPNSGVNVTELNVGIAPKIRFDSMERVKPFISPIGLAFLVNSPPSNDTTYLDVGLNFGAGVDVIVVDWLSVGVDARYTYAFESSNTNTSYYSMGGSLGVLF